MPDKFTPHHPLAYFCAEFALNDSLPIYAGGLGVLAGDYLKEMSDQNVPVVAVSLLYYQGYGQQRISADGEQQEEYPWLNPEKAGLTKVMLSESQPVEIELPALPQPVRAHVWQYQLGSVTLYLLDTNLPDNTPDQRQLSYRLYDSHLPTRLAQEMLLGLGGVRLLHTLDIHPALYHLNEGHSAFAIFELTRHRLTEDTDTLAEAFAKARRKMVFTNHTIIPAGNDIFDRSLVNTALAPYAQETALPLSWMLDLGALPDNHQRFGLTILALNSSAKANTVSQLHQQMARQVWPDYEFTNITNGVHIGTWLADNLKTEGRGEEAEETLSPELWSLHRHNKQIMLDEVSSRAGYKLNPDALTLAWARRFAAYKRPTLLLNDISALKHLIDSSPVPLQLIMAGKAHPTDPQAKELIAETNRLIALHGLEDIVIFVPNYNITLAQKLVAGADVWLNTPIPGQEASGTSGMKAGANGTLLVSTNDGWMAEVDWTDTAWILPKAHTDEALYELLSEEIIPLFADRQNNIPVAWVAKMLKTMEICQEKFSTARMLHEYEQKLYSIIAPD